MALEMYDTVKSTEGRLLAVPKHGGTAEEIKSLTPVLSAYLYTSAGISVGNQTIKTALDTLEGLTMQRAEQTVALRSAVTTSVISKIYDRIVAPAHRTAPEPLQRHLAAADLASQTVCS